MLMTVDALSLEQFCREHYPSLVRLVFVRTGAKAADVEDLVQDILLRAWDGREGYGGRASLETWVTSIARHRIADWFRARGRSERHAEPAALEALRRLGDSAFPAELLDSVEVRSRVAEAMGRLDPDHAELLVLRHVEGLPVKEIARRRGETEGAAESKLVRAREALRSLLGGPHA